MAFDGSGVAHKGFTGYQIATLVKFLLGKETILIAAEWELFVVEKPTHTIFSQLLLLIIVACRRATAGGRMIKSTFAIARCNARVVATVAIPAQARRRELSKGRAMG